MAGRARKRVRRRRVSEKYDDSSDSSSSSSASSTHSTSKATNNATSKFSSQSTESSSAQSESESSESSSSSSSSSSGSSAKRPTAKRGRLAKKQARSAEQQQQSAQDQATSQTAARSPSPMAQSPPAPLPNCYFDPDLALPCLDSLPDFSLPSGLETKPATRPVDGLQSARLKLAQDEERFRAWYMATVVDRFPSELDQLRSSSSTQKSKDSVDLLVAALGAGVDIFDDSLLLPSSSTLALDDRHLVLQTLDLASNQTHLDPTLCPPAPSPPQDVEMASAADDS